MADEGWAGAVGALRLPAQGAAQQPACRGSRRYAGWLGRRRRALARRRRRARASGGSCATRRLLLTTPESLEAMLVSANVDHGALLRRPARGRRRRGPRLRRRRPRLAPAGGPGAADHGSRAARSSGSACRPPSATRTSCWPGSGLRRRRRGPPGRRARASPTVAARAARRHRARLRRLPRQRRHGHRRPAPRREAPGLLRHAGSWSRSSAPRCAPRGVTTFVSHASLSADERRRAEEAFAEARDCVIVATSTLELGIDVGDLDRVIQIDAPAHRRVVPAAARPHRPARRAPPATASSWHSTTTRCSGPPGCCSSGAAGYVEPVVAAARAAAHRGPADAGAVPAGAPGRRRAVARVVERPRALRPSAQT